jgi:hypothetical protein
MKQRQRAPTTDDVIRMIQKDCEGQAEAMCKQIGEVLENVREGNALGALGAMAGIESKIVDLSAILKLLATHASGNAPRRECGTATRCTKKERRAPCIYLMISRTTT